MKNGPKMASIIRWCHHHIITSSRHHIITSSDPRISGRHICFENGVLTLEPKDFFGAPTKTLAFFGPPTGAYKYAFCSIFKIYQIIKLKFLKFSKILQNFKFATFAKCLLNLPEIADFSNRFLRKFCHCSGAKVCKSCKAWKMLSNAYLLAKFRFDTAENEPAKNLQHFAKFANYDYYLPILLTLTP